MHFCVRAVVVALLLVAVYHYYLEYIAKSVELHFYRHHTAPPLDCGPRARSINEIGWLQFAGHALYKDHANEACMLYVAQLSQSTWPTCLPQLAFALCLCALAQWRPPKRSAVAKEPKGPSTARMIMDELNEIYKDCMKDEIILPACEQFQQQARS